MADLKQNPTVVVTLRIPLDVYEHLKMLASEYGVSVPVAFRIYLKQLQTNNTQQIPTTVDKVGKTTPNTSSVPKQMATKQDRKSVLEAWGGDDDA